MKSVSVLVSGRVQGVFFRASTREAALQYGVTGFVRNEPDGSVYIEATGEEESLQRFISWCRKGPPQAIVKDVEVEDLIQVAQFTSFKIDR